MVYLLIRGFDLCDKKSKKSKIKKIKGCGAPVFKVCGGFMVGVWVIRIQKTKIYDDLDQLPWYIDNNWGFKGF